MTFRQPAVDIFSPGTSRFVSHSHSSDALRTPTPPQVDVLKTWVSVHMPVSVMFAAEIRTELQLDVEAANVQKLKARKLFKDDKKV